MKPTESVKLLPTILQKMTKEVLQKEASLSALESEFSVKKADLSREVEKQAKNFIANATNFRVR